MSNPTPRDPGRARVHRFRDSLARGQAGESHLDAVFSRWFHIEPVDDEDQRTGQDRRFTHRTTGKAYRVEYKTDDRAGATGNAFVEVESVQQSGKAGWAITSRAEVLAYYVTGAEVVYCLKLTRLRALLVRWQRQYRLGRARNEGYDSWGILVPLWEFEAAAMQVVPADLEAER